MKRFDKAGSLSLPWKVHSHFPLLIPWFFGIVSGGALGSHRVPRTHHSRRDVRDLMWKTVAKPT